MPFGQMWSSWVLWQPLLTHVAIFSIPIMPHAIRLLSIWTLVHFVWGLDKLLDDAGVDFFMLRLEQMFPDAIDPVSTFHFFFSCFVK